ncbi:hypothetical protein N0V94_003760 [Neodidymelliopsis sp. IMI 364377]|nr:hypothetical protein N0V94_003760 [Neodidymelliopsis sp. IMI 364377]
MQSNASNQALSSTPLILKRFRTSLHLINNQHFILSALESSFALSVISDAVFREWRRIVFEPWQNLRKLYRGTGIYVVQFIRER